MTRHKEVLQQLQRHDPSWRQEVERGVAHVEPNANGDYEVRGDTGYHLGTFSTEEEARRVATAVRKVGPCMTW